MGGIARGACAAVLLAALAAGAPASADMASLKASCSIRDADTGNGPNTLPYWLCDDGTPPFGGESANDEGVQALEVPAAYHGSVGLPAIDAAAAAAVPGNDDGNVALDANLSLPDPDTFPLAGGRKYPLVVFMHGCCSGSAESWEHEDVFGEGDSEKWHHSNAWFASRGYAVLTYGARGFVDGNNHGSTGQTQLDSDRFEINDYQHLAGQLVDTTFTLGGDTFAIDPQRVVVIGGSYGGGFAWMALTDPVWKSPGGADMRLVAVAPRYGWTNLVESLVPNGLDRRDTPLTTDPDAYLQTLGYPKRSINAGLYLAGTTGVPPGQPHTTFPPEIDAAEACLSSFDPFELNPLCATTLGTEFPRFANERSAYFENGFFSGLAAGTIQPVPLFSAGTFTDPLFPPAEHRRMVERLKATVPGYPVQEYYGDYEHFSQDKRKEWSDVCGDDHHVCTRDDYPGGDFNAQPSNLARRGANDRLSDFVDHYAKPPANESEPTPDFDVTASTQICPQNASEAFPLDEPGPTFSAPSFAELAPNHLRARMQGNQTTLNKAVPNLHALAAEPIFNERTNDKHCPLGSGPAGPGVAVYDSPELPRRFTMIGMTRAIVQHTGVGDARQLNARLYDVFPDGTAVMVDRGVKRITSATGPTVLDLHGNGWRFEAGHRLRIELAQDDDPYIKSSNVPSSLTISEVDLDVPVREASATLAESQGSADQPQAGPAEGEPADQPVEPGEPTEPTAADPGDLPFTGLPLLPVFALGALLSLAGLALRSRVSWVSRGDHDQVHSPAAGSSGR